MVQSKSLEFSPLSLGQVEKCHILSPNKSEFFPDLLFFSLNARNIWHRHLVNSLKYRIFAPI